MFKVQVPPEIIGASFLHVKNKNLGNRASGFNGGEDEQLTGCIGQNLVQHAAQQVLMNPDSPFDNGVDLTLFGLSFDVKTMGRTTDAQLHYVNNLVASQISFDVYGYIFLSVNKSNNYETTVCGWLPKDLFLERAKLHPKGTVRTRTDGSSFVLQADTYEIANSSLYTKSEDWMQFFGQIFYVKTLNQKKAA